MACTGPGSIDSHLVPDGQSRPDWSDVMSQLASSELSQATTKKKKKKIPSPPTGLQSRRVLHCWTEFSGDILAGKSIPCHHSIHAEFLRYRSGQGGIREQRDGFANRCRCYRHWRRPGLLLRVSLAWDASSGAFWDTTCTAATPRQAPSSRSILALEASTVYTDSTVVSERPTHHVTTAGNR